MIYVIKGNEPYLINKKLNEIVTADKNANVVKFSGKESSFDINAIIDTCRSVGLFAKHNVVLVKDAPFLSKKTDDNLDVLYDYVKNPTYETDLVFFTMDNNISEKLKSTKEIIKNADYIKLDKLKKYDFYTYAKKMLNSAKLNISKDASDYLINNSNFDLYLLARNLEVLALYPDKIDKKAIEKLISLPDEEDPFNLINAISVKNISKSIEYVNKLLKYDDNILGLISMIASQLRFLYAISYFDNNGYPDDQIMDILNIKNDFRLTKARESLRYIKDVEILNLLSKLSDLDFKCKTSNDIDDKTKLELLIVNLTK